MDNRLSIGQCATLACAWEATIPKPGNVHRGADFEDTTFTDFLTSAVAISRAIDAAQQNPVGETILSAVRATRQWVGTNTNLGAILLLAPLATVPREVDLPLGIEHVLQSLDHNDAALVYQAIQAASPGGLGKVDQMDVAGAAPQDLLAAMRSAADRDLVARQYADNFRQLFENTLPWLKAGLATGWPLEEAVIHAHLRMMSCFPDSLIARKCGPETAAESARRATRALDAGAPGEPTYFEAVADLDFWLRSDGHRRNPGTTADMIAAGLFALLRDDQWPVASDR